MSYESFRSFFAGQREIDKILQLMVKFGASDLHIKSESPPFLRVSGKMRALESAALSAKQVQALIKEVLSERQFDRIQERGYIDCGYMLDDGTRFRLNCFMERGTMALAARLVPNEPPSFKELNLPVDTMKNLATKSDGLVVCAGMTGAGKSTTLASLLSEINKTRRCTIVTIEDPIEYLFPDKKAYVTQRELDQDVPDFSTALRGVLRQDPDVILVGEIRDASTLRFALDSADTGHLVLSSIHGATPFKTLQRMLDMLPEQERTAGMLSLSVNLRAIICQRLLPSLKQGEVMVPILEILLEHPMLTKYLQEGPLEKVIDLIISGRDHGMIDFNHSIYDLLQKKQISKDEAFRCSPNQEALRMLLSGIDLGEDRSLL